MNNKDIINLNIYIYIFKLIERSWFFLILGDCCSNNQLIDIYSLLVRYVHEKGFVKE